jgi:hypothetical protein
MFGRSAALFGITLGLVLALGGCGGAHHGRPALTPGAGQPPDVHFTGGSIPGVVYVGAGPDVSSLDAYRLSGPLSQAYRLTYSPMEIGLQGLTADSHAVVVDRLCCAGLEFVEQLNLALPGGLPGTVLGPGTDPALAPDGRFVHAVSDYQGCGCDALLLRPSLQGPDHVIYRLRHPGTIADAEWSPQGRLAIVVGTQLSNGAIDHPVIVLDPASAHPQRIDPGPTWVLVMGFSFGPHGELSYELRGRVVIRPAAGRPRTFLLNDWDAGCWLENGKIFVFDSLASTLGMLDPTTGAITPIGRYGHLNFVFAFACPPRS